MHGAGRTIAYARLQVFAGGSLAGAMYVGECTCLTLSEARGSVMD